MDIIETKSHQGFSFGTSAVLRFGIHGCLRVNGWTLAVTKRLCPFSSICSRHICKYFWRDYSELPLIPEVECVRVLCACVCVCVCVKQRGKQTNVLSTLFLPALPSLTHPLPHCLLHKNIHINLISRDPLSDPVAKNSHTSSTCFKLIKHIISLSGR